MKYCIYCGEQLNDDATFCTKCGKEVSAKKLEKTKYAGNDGFGFGLASLLLFWFPILSLIFGILGITYGVKASKTSSIVLSIIGLCLMVAFDIVISLMFRFVWSPAFMAWIQQIIDSAQQGQVTITFIGSL